MEMGLGKDYFKMKIDVHGQDFLCRLDTISEMIHY